MYGFEGGYQDLKFNYNLSNEKKNFDEKVQSLYHCLYKDVVLYYKIAIHQNIIEVFEHIIVSRYQNP